MSNVIGYSRVSTNDQDLDIQLAALNAAGCGVILSEKRSGTSTNSRAELRTLRDFLRKGWHTRSHRIDRLARSIADLAMIVRELEAVGSHLGLRISNFAQKKPSNMRICCGDILIFDGFASCLSFKPGYLA
jgi:hypothetical protein